MRFSIYLHVNRLYNVCMRWYIVTINQINYSRKHDMLYSQSFKKKLWLLQNILYVVILLNIPLAILCRLLLVLCKLCNYSKWPIYYWISITNLYIGNKLYMHAVHICMHILLLLFTAVVKTFPQRKEFMWLFIHVSDNVSLCTYTLSNCVLAKLSYYAI